MRDWRRTQAVRERSAKPLCNSSILFGALKKVKPVHCGGFLLFKAGGMTVISSHFAVLSYILIMWNTCYVQEVAMPNVTMSIDEDLLKRARKIAIDQDTTISDLFRNYLDDLTRTDSIRLEYVADELDRLFEKSEATSAGASWTRDSLHER